MASDSAQTSSSSWYIPEVNSETNIDGKEQAAEYLAGLNISQTGIVPFVSIFDDKNDIRNHGYFIPDLPITVEIVKAERDTSGAVHLFNPFIYTIRIGHGRYTWTIQRRHGDFYHLHNRLLFFRAAQKITDPGMRRVRRYSQQMNNKAFSADPGDNAGFDAMNEARRSSGSSTTGSQPISLERLGNEYLIKGQTSVVEEMPARNKRFRHGKATKLPSLPVKPENAMVWETVEQRKKRLLKYLRKLLRVPAYRNNKAMYVFLEVSRFSFVNGTAPKYKEGMVKKKPGNRRRVGSCNQFCIDYIQRWDQRWLMIKDTYIAYLDPTTENLRAVILYDIQFKVRCGLRNCTGPANTFIISNMERDLYLLCESHEEMEAWRLAIHDVLQTPSAQTWLEPHRFGSSFPIRNNSYAQWFVDGRAFMKQVANMLELATEEIYITAWWLSPELYLRRPATDDAKWRLDEVLRRKAGQGVRIFVLLYKEVEMALGINSLYSKRTLQSKHPNIKVMRHPDHVPGRGAILWSHHEKIIVIDQNIAFVGGIDLCYGRWDDYSHKLADLGPTLLHNPRSMQNAVLLNATASAQAIPEISGPEPLTPTTVIDPKAMQDGISSNQDLSDTTTAVTSGAGGRADIKPLDIVKSMELYKEYISSGALQTEKQLGDTPRMERKNKRKMPTSSSQPKLPRPPTQVIMNIEKEYEEKWEQLQEKLVEAGSVDEGVFWIGKDYVNFIFKDFHLSDLHMPFHDFIDRFQTPRMPWHDIHSLVYGAAARDVARHFIQRWNACKIEKLKYDDDYPLLIPKSYEDLYVPRVFSRMAHKTQIQFLRSAAPWSLSIDGVEDSIHQAYLQMIANAKHYIYIENQFFISMVGSTDVTNGICKALVDRILRAHELKETFRVYVVLPLMPNFEGHIDATGGSALQAVMNWTYKSISSGPHSLFMQLDGIVPDPSHYIVFCGLRIYDILADKLVTELIYVHSKLIIVDDRCCLIGSANINDRSLSGKRDSEVAVYIEDSEFEESQMNGQQFMAGKFCGSLRKHLFKEHLGLLKRGKEPESENEKRIDVTDPINDDFYHKIWLWTALKNSDIFEKVFHCIPSDAVRSFDELIAYQAQTPLAQSDKNEALDLLRRVQGRIVLFPTRFMANSSLQPSYRTKEGLAPSVIFT